MSATQSPRRGRHQGVGLLFQSSRRGGFRDRDSLGTSGSLGSVLFAGPGVHAVHGRNGFHEDRDCVAQRQATRANAFVVSEPNDDKLWARVVDTIRLFLRSQWRLGALFGRTEQEAFFITCDRTTMSQDDILNGRLICEIGIAPVRPAEFVIFRIFQNTAEAQR